MTLHHSFTRRAALAAFASGTLAAVAARAADWTRFRGPNGAGSASGTLPRTWTSTSGYLWKTALPGKGNSSPIILGGKVYLQAATADGAKRMLVALDATTGKVDWTSPFVGQPARVHAKSSLASSTPTTDGEKIYATVWDGRAVSLHAVDLQGAAVWSASLGEFASQHGAGMSPIVHAGKVFVNFDQDDAAEIVAFDAKTGAKSWSKPRKAYRSCYSTPLIRELADGATELVVFSTVGCTGYEPSTGKVNWDWSIPWKSGESPMRSVASPLLVGEQLVLLTGDGSGTRYAACITPKGTSATVEWEKRSSKLAPYVPCPVAKGTELYWVTDQGFAECVTTKTGKVLWSERAVNKSVSASPLLVGEEWLFIDEGGRCITAKATPSGYEKVAENDLREAVFATPAFVDGMLYLRTASSLYCVKSTGK